MTFGVIGGDGRQKALAALLAEDGMDVSVWGLGEEKECCERAISSDVILLPLPLSNGKGELRFGGGTLPLKDLFARLQSRQHIFAGQVKETDRQAAGQYGLQIEDYFLREELTVANAAITADCAIELVCEKWGELPDRVLVLGFGRIGKLLCQRLQKQGISPWAAARKHTDLAWIRAYGYGAVEIGKLSGKISEFDLIINTIPAPVLDKTLLSGMCCPIMDLASQPCLTDTYPGYMQARGLPGKMAPNAAAKAIRDTVYEILSER